MGKHKIKCVNCGKEYCGYALSCDCNSLLRAEYKKSVKIKKFPGMWKYIDWLPCNKPINTKSGPITYKSENLAKELGLNNLYISFNGYWPEKNAFNMTCSFKDLEASPTVSRAIDNKINSILISSAGNTARAFAHVSNKTNFEVYLVVPEKYLYRLWTPEEPGEKVHLIVVKGDYSDAIELGTRIIEKSGIFPEGGAKNIARRDGMGTVMLDAANYIGQIPNHYFQAVGSGTGAIACWEMAIRLRKNGWKGWPNLNLSQNIPFVPIHNAWNAGHKKILSEDIPNAKQRIKKIYSTVLSNRNPPYSIKGGLYNALSDTNGRTYAISNEESKNAQKLFNSLEGIDILPPAGVTVASLIHAVDKNKVQKNEIIILNITGGGEDRIKEDFGKYKINPEIYVDDIKKPEEDIL